MSRAVIACRTSGGDHGLLMQGSTLDEQMPSQLCPSALPPATFRISVAESWWTVILFSCSFDRFICHLLVGFESRTSAAGDEFRAGCREVTRFVTRPE